MRPLLSLGLAASVFVALSLLACEDSSPAPGDACSAVGGTCTMGACGESLPYPCSAGQSCCRPVTRPGDAGGG